MPARGTFAILPVLLDNPALLATVITFSILSGLLVHDQATSWGMDRCS